MVQEIATSLVCLNQHSTEVKTSLAALENKFGDRFKEMENRFEKVENQLLKTSYEKRRAERDERENSCSDQGCATELSSGIEDTKQSNMHILWIVGIEPLSSAD